VSKLNANKTTKNDEYFEQLVNVNRVSKTVKGGRIFKFSALMVVGDRKGSVGVGIGKSGEIPDAIRKGIENAKKNMVKVSLYKDTIPHISLGKFGASRILLKPAPPGTGILSGASARAVFEAAGISDIRAKLLRSNNPCNAVKAAIHGLQLMRNAHSIAETRGKTMDEIVH